MSRLPQTGILLLLAVAVTASDSPRHTTVEPQSASGATGPWVQVRSGGRTLELLDGALVEIRGRGRLTFRDGRRTIVVPDGLRAAAPDGTTLPVGGFEGTELRLVDDVGATAWVVRRVDALPDGSGTRIRDEKAGEASISTQEEVRFFIHVRPGDATEFFHPAHGGDAAVRRVRQTLDRFAGYGFSGVVAWSDAAGGASVTIAAGRRSGPGSSPMDENTLFELGSLTKQLTAAAVLELEDDGELSVHDELRRWQPELPPEIASISLHQLLLHTSGLPEDADVPGDDVRAVWRALADVELVAPPGDDWMYSNLGYVVLAAVVEETAPAGYRGLVAELVRRSGVDDLGFPELQPEWARRFAVGGSGPLGTGRITERWPIEPAGWDTGLGATGAVATMPALHDWFRALRVGRVLSRAATERMFAEHPPEVAYGWFYLHEDDGSVRIAHGGDTPGFQTWLSYEPARDLVIVLGVNDRRGWRNPLLDAIDVILGQDSLPDLPPQVLVASRLDVTGSYSLPDGSTIEAVTAGERLRLAASGPVAIAMITGAGRALADSLVEASGRAAALLSHLLRADTGAVEAMLKESGRPESFWRIWSHLTAEHSDPPLEGDVIGTIPERAGRLVTFMRVTFRDGTETLRLVWRPHLDGWGTGGELPTRDFWPAGDDRLVSFDPTRPGWVELRLIGGDGRLVLRDASGRRAVAAGPVQAGRG